jgi:8-amino-7-oxononanoate synthase
MDLFDRCRRFYRTPEFAQRLGYRTSPRMAQALGLYPYFVPIERCDGPEATVDGRTLVMLGSNNYLGLTTHPRVVEAAVRAARTYGTGCTGSRFLNGSLRLHEELEEALAAYLGTERALVFATGYQTNVGVITALLGRHDVVIADRESHASLRDGISMAKGMRGASARPFRHNDLRSLEEVLAACCPGEGKLVAVDGVFSMGGDVAPLPGIVDLCRKFGASLLVDDAHGLGVLGGGRGTAAELGCADGVDVLVGTFSKSLASTGGFVAGRREIVHWIQHFGRSFMFSASLPPASTAAALASLAILREEPGRVRRVNEVAATMRRELTAMGYDTGASQTPIVPILVGDDYRAMQAWHLLAEAGVYVNVAVPPAVRRNRSLLRTSYMATHTDAHLDRALAGFRKVRDRILQHHTSTRAEAVACAVAVGTGEET